VQGDQPAALVREVRSFLRERFDPPPVGD